MIERERERERKREKEKEREREVLRCKLSFFGATHFDPRSDRWVRICMFGNAPYPEELASSDEFWPYPSAARP